MRRPHHNIRPKYHQVRLMRSLYQAFYILLLLCLRADSFQNGHNVKSIFSATKFRENRRKSVTDSSGIRPIDAFGGELKASTTSLFSNNDYETEKAENYNDDAFGFVLLIGYVVTHDVIFAGTFVLLSALAAIATQNGKLPATKSVPAAVAGLTYIVNLIIPNERLYELLPFIERPETSLPVDISLVQLGICSVSMLYGFVLSSPNQEEDS